MISRLPSSLFLVLTSVSLLSAQGSFPPAAGQDGSSAISKDSSIIISWATGISLVRGAVQINDPAITASGSNLASFGHASEALHAAEGSSAAVVSLGDGGMATLTFDRLIVDGPGPDFAVFENSFTDNFLELAFVEVSSDGVNFSRFPAVSMTQTNTQTGPWDELNPENIHNLAGKYRQGFGTPFDLSELEYKPQVDIYSIRFVRIIDVKGSVDPQYASMDSQGNKINDPFPTPFDSCGFDLDGVAVINGNLENPVVDLNELSLNPESFFVPQDNGTFNSGPLSFHFDAGTGYWSGFSYSNLSTPTGNYTTDQFLSASSAGMDGDSTNYAVSYILSDWTSETFDPIPAVIGVNGEQALTIGGLYINNSMLTYNALLNGTPFSKKFGGITGDDPDWFKVRIWGVKSDNSYTQSIEHFLADFRPRDNNKDYIQKEWKWLDLQVLGEVKALHFVIESSDTGDFGINSPAYFCIDNISIMPKQGPVIKSFIPDQFAEMNADPLSVKMFDHFYAYNSDAIFEVSENSNPSLIKTSITGPVLISEITQGMTGFGDITVKATSNGISISDTFRIRIGSGVGMPEKEAFRFEVYPNPTRNLLQIKGNNPSVVRLFNTSGKLVIEKPVNENNGSLSLEKLPAGLYFLRIISPDGNSTVKIIKE